MSEPKKNYLEPDAFFRESLICLQKGYMSEELGQMFMLLSERVANHPNFVRYTHLRDDLISTGIMACCRAWNKFRPNRNILTRNEEGEVIHSEPVQWDGKLVDYHHELHYSPHAFHTTVIFNSFLQFLKKEYNSRNVMNALKLSHGLDADYGYTEMKKEQEDKERDEMVEMEEMEAVEEVDEDDEIDHVGITW